MAVAVFFKIHEVVYLDLPDVRDKVGTTKQGVSKNTLAFAEVYNDLIHAQAA
jgi:hypothetical protein